MARHAKWLRTGLPLALSLGVHLALLAYLATRTAPASPPPQKAPIDLELIAWAPPEKVNTPEPEKVTPAPQKRPRAKAQAVREDVKAPTDPIPSTQDQETNADAVKRDDAPLEDAPKRLVTLTPKLDLSDSPKGGNFPVLVQEVPAQKTPDQLVNDLVKDSIGRGKVDRGLVHPYYQELGKVLLRKWDADRAVSSKGLKGFVEQGIENNRQFAKVWQNRAQEYGSTGSPLGKEEYLGPERPVVGDPNLAARRQLAMKMRDQFKQSRRALFRVTQSREGKLLSVELIQPSNDDAVDREAMQDVRTAAEALPPPPSEVVGTRETLVSIWQFELIISISPPVPSFSFEFDEALKFVDARLPLDRRIYKRVRLVSAD